MLKNKSDFKTCLNTVAFGKLFYNKKLDLFKLKVTFKFINSEFNNFSFNKCDYISGDFDISEFDIQFKQAKIILKTNNIHLL